ncbi:MAG: hypothetical protein HY720_01270 [Planctomycetes bacterium]|nr:hypothetical protein [Planctomycetota bacterium]
MPEETEQEKAQKLARENKLPFVDLSRGTVPEQMIGTVPLRVAREYDVFPLKKQGRVLLVATTGVPDRTDLDHLRAMLGVEVECAITTKSAMREALDRHYGLKR